MQRETFNQKRLQFGTDSNGRPLVYRPNEVLVRVAEADVAEMFSRLDELNESNKPIAIPNTTDKSGPVAHRRISANWAVFKLAENVDPKDAVEVFRLAGYRTQLNHVYFAGALRASPNYAAPNYAAPNYAAPNYAAPNYAAPNYAAPNYAAPNYAASRCFHGDCYCGEPRPAPKDQPEVPKNTARKARRDPGAGLYGVDHPDLQIHVLDVRPQVNAKPTRNAAQTKDWINNFPTGTDNSSDLISNPGALLPEALFLADELASSSPTAAFEAHRDEYIVEPSSKGQGANVNPDAFLDPVTNHTAFIKGIIDRTMRPTAGGSYVTTHSVMGTLGEVDDASLVRAMEHVAFDSGHQPVDDKSIRIMNLSLSGYVDTDTPDDVLAETVELLQAKGWLIVASAGNNGSCRPARPASLPEVVSVGAYGPCGPAWFSDYGWWVDACAPGVDIVSDFPNIEAGPLHVHDGLDTDSFDSGFARWSGTSFAAPYLAALLARWIAGNAATELAKVAYSKALAELVTHPDAVRIPGYGTVISDETVRIQTVTAEI